MHKRPRVGMWSAMVVVLSGLLCASAQAWWDSGWTQRLYITFPGVGAASLTDFPVLVRLDAGNFDFALARPDGGDLRLVAADDSTLLDFEVERYDAANQVAELWVRIPTLDSSTRAYLYFGNAGASFPNAGGTDTEPNPGSNPTAVWDSGFLAVYHFNEASGNFQDSTSHNYDAVEHGGVTHAVPGQIGFAASFDGVDDYCELPGVPNPVAPWTTETWGNTVAPQSNPWDACVYFSKRQSEGEQSMTLQVRGPATDTASALYGIDASYTWFGPQSTPPLPLGQFVYLAGTNPDANLWLYVNDAQYGPQAAWGSASSADNWRLANHGAWGVFSHAMMDEVRISGGVVRTPDWFAATYHNTATGSTFVSVSTVEFPTPGPTDTPTGTPTDTPTDTDTPTASPTPTWPPRIGGEFQINTTITDNQTYPAIGMDAAGDFTVVWQSYNQDGFGSGIFGQRYDAQGTPVEGEFQVNTVADYGQYYPAIGMEPEGSFAVVWKDYSSVSGNGGWPGVSLQFYDSAGQSQGGSFAISPAPNYYYYERPDVAKGPNGTVVTWKSSKQNAHDIRARLFDAQNEPVGDAFRVSQLGAEEDYPAVAVNATGEFVVTWVDYTDGSGADVLAAQFNTQATPLTGNFKVNTYTYSDQEEPCIAMDPAGEFVIAWSSYEQGTGGNWGIFAQRFNAQATPLAAEFQVNETTDGQNFVPSAAMNVEGNFVITWGGYPPNSGNGHIMGRWFNPESTPLGPEFLVNTYTWNLRNPAVAMDSAGDFTVVWQSADQDGDGYGIFGQRFLTVATPLPTDTPTDTPTTTPSPAATRTTNALGVNGEQWRWLP